MVSNGSVTSGYHNEVSSGCCFTDLCRYLPCHNYYYRLHHRYLLNSNFYVVLGAPNVTISKANSCVSDRILL